LTFKKPSVQLTQTGEKSLALVAQVSAVGKAAKKKLKLIFAESWRQVDFG